MSEPLLQTKLYLPATRSSLVPRAQLLAKLNAGLNGRLTLVSAPAGFGKTTLVSSWIHHLRLNVLEKSQIVNPKPVLSKVEDVEIANHVAWLSLDQGDNDLARFLAYLVAALQKVAPHVGGEVLELVQTAQLPPIEPLLTSLLNELSELTGHFILVLDDYHVIKTQAIDETIIFLIEHLPPQMHLVITTREDPPFPLARYRVRSQMNELRVRDLRFTLAETAEFLNQVMGLNLTESAISVLESRTEGWVAGLQMAALSMQGRTDTAVFIQSFSGSHRFVLDYLVEEVLQQQPEQVRTFLLQTAVLDRLSSSLCDAVTGQKNGSQMLETLERDNLFLIPLDDQRHWYRYHHLFANALQMRALTKQPEQIPTLHLRASQWFEQQNLPSKAIQHALAAEDFERTAALIERAWPTMRRRRREATILGWVRELPNVLIRLRPVLSVVYALALLDSGQLVAVETRLQDAERWLAKVSDANEQTELSTAEMVVVDKKQFRSLPASIANARAYHAQARGDVPSTVNYAQQALALLPTDDYYERGTTSALLGLAYWASGELEIAHRTFADGLATLQMGGSILISVGGTSILAAILVAQGRLNDAFRTYDHALQLAAEQPKPMHFGTADLHRGISEIYYEWGDLEAATQHLLTSKQQGEQTGLWGDKVRWCVAQARLKQAQGKLDDALELLKQAERLHHKTPVPDVRPIAALKARVWVAQGRLKEAFAWAREQALSVDDDLSYLCEVEHITLARILIAQYRHNQTESALWQAGQLLERLLVAAEDGGRVGSLIEILILQAVVQELQDDLPSALVPLARALTLAEPEHYIQIFVDEGVPMTTLLTRMKAADKRLVLREVEGMRAYIQDLLAAFDNEKIHLSSTNQRLIPHQPLIEPLSQRELEVLRFLKTDLSGPDIARELVIALSTLRTHTKRIYSKLNVNNRRTAVRRAQELNLLD